MGNENQEHDDESGEIEEVNGLDDGVTDTDDGGAIVDLESGDGSNANAQNNLEFYSNIMLLFDPTDLESMGTNLLEKIERDKDSRKRRIDEYTDALKRTGLGDDSPGGAQFQGASRVVHPILVEGVIDYSARATAELLPPDGPVRIYIPDEVTKERAEKAERKAKHMNWQFRRQMKEFKTELEQIQTQSPLAGVAYLRLVYDAQKKRPVPTFIPVDDIFLPFACNSFYTAERMTWGERITEQEFERRIRISMYENPEGGSIEFTGKIKAPPAGQLPEESKAKAANNAIEGVSPDNENIDGLRRVFLVQTYLEEQADKEAPSDQPAPYLISIDEVTRKVVSIVRNWDIDEHEVFEPMHWILEWPFIPWRGAYPIGLNQAMAGIPAAVTGALRALLDSAHINNLPTLLRLKGANFVGQTNQLNVGQVTEVEGGISGDDIRKLIMAVPFHEPSATLYSLMGMLVETGKGVVRTTMDNLADQAATMPATTALALIEQGMKVTSAIHLRQWTAMDRTIEVLHRINRMYITDDDIKDDTGTMLARHNDYVGPIDCIPTADPQVFSDAQRFAQINLVAQRATGNPLYDQRKVEELILERTRLPNAKDLLVPKVEPKPMNAVNENVAMTMGRPVVAFPDQDHLAHLQVLLDFALSPVLGQLPIIAPSYLPKALDHIKEHLVMWYVTAVYEIGNSLTKGDGRDFGELIKTRDEGTGLELDRLLAEISSGTVVPRASKLFSKYPQIIQQLQQLMRQFMPPPVTDPSQVQLQVAQMRQQSEAQKLAARQQETNQRSQTQMQITDVREQGAQQRNEAQLATKEQINKEDNLTALTIAGGEIASGHRSNLETGTGINPSP